MLGDLQSQLATVRARKQTAQKSLQALQAEAAALLPDVANDIGEAEVLLDALLSDFRRVVSSAASLSGPVGELEKVKTRAEAALQRVRDLAKMSELMQSLRTAAKENRLAEATRCVFELTQFAKTIPMEEKMLVEFTKTKEAIGNLVKSKFGEALAAKNDAEMENCAEMIQKLGLSREGIDSYIGYILTDLSQAASQAFELLQTSDGAGKYEDALVRLFRLVAKSLSTHKDNLLSKFGSDGVTAFILGLRREVDLQASRLYSKFRGDRQISRWEEELKKTNSLQLDLKATDSLCAEVATIIKHSESFENYFKSQTSSVGQSAAQGKVSELKMKMQELVNVYVSFEVHYMNKAITKAVDSLDETSQVSSSLKSLEPIRTGAASDRIDELFYVLRQSTQRALRTFNIDNICAVLNHIPVHLSEQLLEKLRSRTVPLLKQQLLSAQFQQSTASIILIVNLMELSQQCTAKLVTELKTDFLTVFGSAETSEHQMFLFCMESLTKAGERFKAASQDCLEKAVDSFRAQTATLTAPLSALSYELTEEQLAEYEVNDPFAHSFSSALKSLLKQWKAQLEPDSSDLFIDLVAFSISEDLEKRIRAKKCNDLGAVQLEKDIREVTKTLQSLSQRPVRLRFQRLKQITQLLSASSESEVQSLMKGSDWKLAVSEVRQTLQLRSGRENVIVV